VTLSVAGASTSVQVTGDAEMVQLESSTLGGLVNDRAVQALPLSSRNFTQIMGLAPGVVADLPTATVLGNGTQNVASNGATPTANNIQFNGVDANNLVESSAATAQTFEIGVAIPAPDTIQEFRVRTRDRGERGPGQQERNEPLSRQRMGVCAQQPVQRERFLFEAGRSAAC
jgi:hypothetical protein